MRRIYKTAERVVIWLGQDDKQMALLAFSVICSLASGGTVAGNQVKRAGFYSNGVLSTDIPGMPYQVWPPPDDSEATWKSLEALFGCSWFWRVWCLQEVALAKEAIVIWGNCEISWRHIGLAAARLRTNHYRILQRYNMPGVFNAYLMYRISQCVSEIAPLDLSFLRLLTLTRQFECSDPRDRIYGLIGLPTTDADPDNGKFFMTPDYTLKTIDVYRRFAEQILEENANGIDLLRSVQHGKDLEDGWPSWIPHWDRVHTRSLAPVDMIPPPVNLTIVSLRPNLIIRGWVVSDILASLDRRIDTSKASFLDGLDLRILLHDKSSQRRVCWTLTAGKNWYGLPILDAETDSHMADFAAYISAKHPEHMSAFESWPDDGDEQRFIQAASNACDERKLFWTRNGSIGLGPAALRTTDLLVTMVDWSEPRNWCATGATFVIRPSLNRTYRLVGECYVYDFIYGLVTADKNQSRVNIELH
jgi:hypothetical protein